MASVRRCALCRGCCGWAKTGSGRPAEAVSTANVSSLPLAQSTLEQTRDHPGCLFYMPRPCVLTRLAMDHHLGVSADCHDACRYNVQDLRKASSLLPLRHRYLRLCRTRPQQRGVAGGNGRKRALALACLWCLQATSVPRLLGGVSMWAVRMVGSHARMGGGRAPVPGIPCLFMSLVCGGRIITRCVHLSGRQAVEGQH